MHIYLYVFASNLLIFSLQSTGDSASVKGALEAQLQKFSADQRQVLNNLREELQQQNQALIYDISRLLEGFASQVGRAVKRELETALSGLSLSDAGTRDNSRSASSSQNPQPSSGDIGPESMESWDMVPNEEPPTNGDVTDGNQIFAGHPIEQAVNETGRTKWTWWQSETQVEQHTANEEGNSKAQPRIEDGKPQGSNGGSSTVKPTFSSLFADAKSENVPPCQENSKQETCNGPITGKPTLSSHCIESSVKFNVHFLPMDRPADMRVTNFSKLSGSGQIIKSPLYQLHDCPFMVQLSLWFDSLKELKMYVTFWGLSHQPLKFPRIFTISGEIKNWGSSEFTSLFCENSPPLNLQKSWFQNVELPCVLKTSRGHHSHIKLDTLAKRKYVLQGRDSISIAWNVFSKEVKV